MSQKFFYFHIIIFCWSYIAQAETYCQTCARLCGDTFASAEAFSAKDTAVLKLVFECLKKKEIISVKYKKYSYFYNKNDYSHITFFYNGEEKRKIGDYEIEIDNNRSVLDLFCFPEVGDEDVKININQNDEWFDIGDFVVDLKLEEQLPEVQKDNTDLKIKVKKKLCLDFISPGNHGVFFLKIEFNENINAFLFIDYIVTLGEGGLYYYTIQDIFVKQSNQDIFNDLSHDCNIIRSNDGENNEFKITLQ